MQVLALSVRQPFAQAILTGQKVEEYRTFRIKYRGLLAIHAARTLAKDAFADYPNFAPDRVVTGAVLGLVEVVDCQEEVYGGSFAWILARPRWLKKSVAVKGRVGLFPALIPDELL